MPCPLFDVVLRQLVLHGASEDDLLVDGRGPAVLRLGHHLVVVQSIRPHLFVLLQKPTDTVALTSTYELNPITVGFSQPRQF